MPKLIRFAVRSTVESNESGFIPQKKINKQCQQSKVYMVNWPIIAGGYSWAYGGVVHWWNSNVASKTAVGGVSQVYPLSVPVMAQTDLMVIKGISWIFRCKKNSDFNLEFSYGAQTWIYKDKKYITCKLNRSL